MCRRRAGRGLARELESKSLGQALDVAPVEELDPNLRVTLAELAELPVLARDERLLHHGHLDIEVLLREVEVRRERVRDAPVGRFFERERMRLVLPRDAVEVEQACAFALR